MKDLYVVVNEKIYNNKNLFFCENKDIQSIINYLSDKHNLILISRFSKYVRPLKLSQKCKIFNLNFLKFITLCKFLHLHNKNKILIISVTPFNFIFFIFFKFFFNSKFYLYLRSNGHEEYKSILGEKYVWIYDLMFQIITKYSEVISCQKKLYKKKCHLLRPSELNTNWKKNIKINFFKKRIIKIIYVGRFKVEKGFYSLLNIFSKLPKNIRLVLVGNGSKINKIDSRIKIINYVSNEKKLIKLYDAANICILPSFTEAHPKVLDEALSRMRPVIIFNDIKHVINNRKGVFSISRDFIHLNKIISYIQKNIKKINLELKNNKLPDKKTFLQDLHKILSDI